MTDIIEFIQLFLVAYVSLFVLFIFSYLYSSFSFFSIARKNQIGAPGIAFIPLIGPAIIAFKASDMHWWPWVLLILIFIPLIGFVAQIIFLIYVIIWCLKFFEKLNNPKGKFIILTIYILNLILSGIFIVSSLILLIGIFGN